MSGGGNNAVVADVQASRDQHKSVWEERERQMQDMLKAEQERRARDEHALMSRMRDQEAGMRQRQQENSLFVQAQELNSMLDQQEQEMMEAVGQGGPGGPQGGPPGALPHSALHWQPYQRDHYEGTF